MQDVTNIFGTRVSLPLLNMNVFGISSPLRMCEFRRLVRRKRPPTNSNRYQFGHPLLRAHIYFDSAVRVDSITTPRISHLLCRSSRVRHQYLFQVTRSGRRGDDALYVKSINYVRTPCATPVLTSSAFILEDASQAQ